MKYSESGKGSCPIRLMPPIRNIYDEMSANGTMRTIQPMRDRYWMTTSITNLGRTCFSEFARKNIP